MVAEVRETSRKPDEMYSLLERLSPGTRKLEVRRYGPQGPGGGLLRVSARAMWRLGEAAVSHVLTAADVCGSQIFARPHNLFPGWISLGNQLDGVKVRALSIPSVLLTPHQALEAHKHASRCHVGASGSCTPRQVTGSLCCLRNGPAHRLWTQT